MTATPASAPWRTLVSRTSGWTRDAYASLMVTLNTEEKQLHACAASAINAGYVRKDQLDVRRAMHVAIGLLAVAAPDAY